MATVIGNMALLVANLNASAARHRQKAEMLMDSARYLGLPPKMQERVQVCIQLFPSC